MSGRFTVFLLLLPALLVMTVSGVVPAGFIAFYSLHDTFAGNSFVWVGPQWYVSVLSSPEFWWALARSLGYSALVLLIEVPLGIYIALRLPAAGPWAAVLIVLLAIPLLAPQIVVGYLFKVMTMPRIGLLHAIFTAMGPGLDMNNKAVVWAVLLLMDAWHWTSLVVLLCYAGLRAIPQAYYQAARIDGAGRWAIFRHIELPRLRLVLLIAILLRLMDSFMIYAEAYVVTRGGPGVSTTFLSHELVQTATIQFDLGEGGAMSILYLLIVVAISWAFFSLIVPRRERPA
ncbi:sugar ABC transporter permease [Aestuariivirga litoralis]|uniref:Sugar ABC transporter permease n=1 Tax=Aestuariivirga litoralis TaxID=2650924 RepID=A0A2W2BT84_9HYPH|nr:sugar ABC transporter permease [Aestuariivirga litoralis]PZF78897.1 sugar ABC transporter permease [Aestuariivirga litoralis]